MPNRDLCSQPFSTLVALGESITVGSCATEERHRWVNVVADLISEFQGQPVKLHNMGIGANVLSPRSPGYQASAKPSMIERYREDVIALEPDLFILACGINDMRPGMNPEHFREDVQRIISDVGAACKPVIVLVSIYHMSAYDLYPPFDKGSPEATEVFNTVLRQLAEANDCLFADVYAAMGRADWTVHPDTVHPNDLGHRLIGHRVFQTIAANCSGVAAKVTTDLRDAAEEVARTMHERKAPQDYGG